MDRGPAAGAAHPAAPPHRVLVVEDDPRVGRFIVEGLRSEGYDVEHAATAAIALQFDLTHHIDLVLLDHMLPDRSGLTVAKAWRDSGQTLPIVMLTARDSAEDRRAAFDAGVNAFLAKPFKFDDLLSQITALLQD